MWKNKEIRRLMFSILTVNIVALVTSAIYLLDSFLWMMIICLLFDCIIVYYTFHRYREIQKLSDYLMQMYTGGTLFDIRDNHEGELSILKNDIYKVTQTLVEQSDNLHKDKIFLVQTLTDISHQLKTPLTSMMVLCDVMADEHLTEIKRHSFNNRMRNQLERMQWLVKALLTLSRIDAKAIVFKQERIDVKYLIDACMKSFSILMEVKEINLLNTCCADVKITGDQHWLIEAISNVLKNAIEHTHIKGDITITCEDNPIHTSIIISNDGNKIDEEDRLHIFDRFYKGKNASSDSIGIGLALSKTIIQHQNGTIECKNDDKWTHFIIKFYKYHM